MRQSESLLARFIERQRPVLEQAIQQEDAACRARLRADLAQNQGKDFEPVKALIERSDACNAKLEQLRKQVEAARITANAAMFDVSNARSAHGDARDFIWNELRKVPDSQLVEFRREVEARQHESMLFQRRWSTGRADAAGAYLLTVNNYDSVQKHISALLVTLDSIDVAIRSGLDGEAAKAAIASMRAAWPKIQVGLNEFIVPPAPRLNQ